MGRMWDGITTATTEGRKASGEALSDATDAFTSDPRIYGTTAAAVAMPALVATTVLGGKELIGAGVAGGRRAAPYLNRGIDKLGKAAKRTRELARDAGRKADINIRTSRTGAKHNLDLDKVADGASSLFDELPPSTSKNAARIAAAKEIREQADEFYKIHDLKWGKKVKERNNANNTK